MQIYFHPFQHHIAFKPTASDYSINFNIGIVCGSLMHAYENGELNLEQRDSVLLCALQWNLSTVVTPGTVENILISDQARCPPFRR